MRGWFQRCGARVEASWSQRRIAACSVHGWGMVFEGSPGEQYCKHCFMAQEDHDTIPIKKTDDQISLLLGVAAFVFDASREVHRVLNAVT